MPGMVYNPDLHRREMKRKINKNIGLEDLCHPRSFNPPGHAGKNQQQNRMEGDPQDRMLDGHQHADDIEQD